MRYDHAESAKPPERVEEQGARVPVGMVRRLVEEEHVGAGGERRPELPALALAGRARPPAREVGGIEAERAAEAPRLAVIPCGEGGRVRPGLVHALRAQHDARGAGIDAESARAGRERARDEREEGRLSGAVLADEAHPAVVQGELGFLEDLERRPRTRT